MKKTRYRLSDDRHIPSFGAFVQVLPNPGTLQRVIVSLEGMHVVSDPLLDECREKCRRKAENKGHEPKGIHTDIRCRWVEGGERGRWYRWDGDLWNYGGYLLRDLRKHRDILLQVVYCLICRARLQILFAVDYEGSESSRK